MTTADLPPLVLALWPPVLALACFCVWADENLCALALAASFACFALA